MRIQIAILALWTPGALLLAGCQSAHFFPRNKPLFSGLDQSGLPAASHVILARAKADFQRVRNEEPPIYARQVSSNKVGGTKVYQGNGYKLTVYDVDQLGDYADGPEIIIDAHVVNGNPYRYSEVNTWNN